ncbi:MAG TPA: CPBP family glutamic-type intramembrane protease [Longimicrobiales bacterium]
MTGGLSDGRNRTNGHLLLPYLAPYGAYVLIASLAPPLPRALDYLLRIGITTGLLIMCRRHYQPLRGPNRITRSIGLGVVAGVLGALLWSALLLPFKAADAGEPITVAAFLLRLAAAVTIVPIAEELLCRGYILGVITQWQEARRAGSKTALADVLDRQSIHSIRPGAATAAAVLLSSLAFALGHPPAQWLASFSYGIVMAGLWILGRDLLTPITAHAVTNLVLYSYIFSSGAWGLW